MAAGEASISASVGIGLYPDHARSSDELVRNADAAMYAAKNAGKNCYRFYGDASSAGGRWSLPSRPQSPVLK